MFNVLHKNQTPFFIFLNLS